MLDMTSFDYFHQQQSLHISWLELFSSRYLEELSQRYRKRMEDMYETLDTTINRLTVTSKNAEVQVNASHFLYLVGVWGLYFKKK